jgi:hypothetical protein
MDYYYTSDGHLMKKEKEMNIFDTEMDKYPADFMANEWPESDAFLESIFSSDILKELDGPDLFMSPIDTASSLENTFVQQTLISSNSSDSGLSTDHLDIDISPDYEPLSPALSSPGPSISERGGSNSPPSYHTTTIKSEFLSTPPRVTVEKINQLDKNLMFNRQNPPAQQHQTTDYGGIQKPKEVKIYRVPQQSTMDSSQIGKKVLFN